MKLALPKDINEKVNGADKLEFELSMPIPLPTPISITLPTYFHVDFLNYFSNCVYMCSSIDSWGSPSVALGKTFFIA